MRTAILILSVGALSAVAAAPSGAYVGTARFADALIEFEPGDDRWSYVRADQSLAVEGEGAVERRSACVLLVDEREGVEYLEHGCGTIDVAVDEHLESAHAGGTIETTVRLCTEDDCEFDASSVRVDVDWVADDDHPVGCARFGAGIGALADAGITGVVSGSLVSDAIGSFVQDGQLGCLGFHVEALPD